MATFNEPDEPVKDVVFSAVRDVEFMAVMWSEVPPLGQGVILALDELGTREVIRVRLDWEQALRLSREILDIIEEQNPYDNEVSTDSPSDF